MSDATDESTLRRDLMATCRLFGLYRLAHIDDARITVRAAGGVLAKPDDVAFDRMTVEDVLFVPEGATDDRADAETLALHRAILAARPEAQTIIEVTGSAAGAVAAGQAGVLPISQFSMQFYNRLGIEELPEPGDNRAPGIRTAAALDQHMGVIRRHRGMLVCGRTVPEAFIFMFYLIRSCQIQVQALTGNPDLVLPSHEVAEHTARQYERDPTPSGKREWPALLRLVDRIAR